MRLLHHPERRPPPPALGRRPPRQFSCHLPRRIRCHRAATGDELTQRSVIHPHTSEKPCPDLTALRRIWPQRPGPHMGRRALRPLTRTRPTHRRLPSRCRCDAIGLTHRTTVEVTTDNNDLSPCAAQRVAAARTPRVLWLSTAARCSPMRCSPSPRAPFVPSAPISMSTWSSSTEKPTTCTRWSPSYFAVSYGGAPLSIIKQYIDGQAQPL
jgi:hypothetical protein